MTYRPGEAYGLSNNSFTTGTKAVGWHLKVLCMHVCMRADAKSCLTLCDPMDCSPSGSTVHGIFQARILEELSLPSLRDLPDPGIKPGFPALQADSLPCEPPGNRT